MKLMIFFLYTLSCIFFPQHCTIYDSQTQSHVVNLSTSSNQATSNQSKSNFQVTQTYSHATNHEQALKDDFACRKQFQMGLCTFLNLMSSSHADFLSKIKENKFFSAQTIQKLFTEYKKGCYRQNSKKMQWLENEIKNEIQTREHSKNVAKNNGSPLPASPKLQIIIPQTYSFSVQAQELFDLHNVDITQFQNISLTPEQQALTSNIVDHYEALADLVFSHHAENSAFIPELIQINDLAFQATKEKAFSFAHFCNHLVDQGILAARSIFSGFTKGIQNNLEFMMHPIQTIQGLAHVSSMILQTLHHRLEIIGHNATAPLLGHEHHPLWSQDKTTIAAVTTYAQQIAQDWILQTSPHQKIEKLSELATDFIISPWLLASACNKFKRFNQVLTKITPELSAEHKVATTVGDIEIAAAQKEQSIMQFFESEAASAFNARHGFSLMPFEDVILKAAQFEGKIPVVMTELVESLKHHIATKLKCANITIDPKIRKEFEVVQQTINGKLETVFVDLEHIFNWGFNVKPNNNGTITRFWLDGGHLPGSAKRLEKTGLISIMEETILPNQSTAYTIQDLVTGKTITKTEFPAHWSQETVMKNIFEATQNITTVHELSSSNYIITGQTKNNRSIRIVFNNLKEAACLTTAYVEKL